MRTKVELTGFEELDRKLQKLAEALPDRTKQKVLTEAGGIIADEARMLVPVDTGNLRNSITVGGRRLGGAFKMDMGLGGGAVHVFIGPRSGGRGADGWYGHFLEFGTVKMAAQPFMRPAFDSTEGQVRSRIASELRMEVMKAAGG